MKTSENGLNLIKKFESLKLNAYLCPAGIWTIGYGHTGNVKEGDLITKEIADELLIKDVEIFENKVKRNIKVELNQNQFDALVSYFFNIGYSEEMIKLVNQKASNERIRNWLENHYITANGKILEGLKLRRKAEADLFCKI